MRPSNRITALTFWAQKSRSSCVAARDQHPTTVDEEATIGEVEAATVAAIEEDTTGAVVGDTTEGAAEEDTTGAAVEAMIEGVVAVMTGEAAVVMTEEVAAVATGEATTEAAVGVTIEDAEALAVDTTTVGGEDTTIDEVRPEAAEGTTIAGRRRGGITMIGAHHQGETPLLPTAEVPRGIIPHRRGATTMGRHLRGVEADTGTTVPRQGVPRWTGTGLGVPWIEDPLPGLRTEADLPRAEVHPLTTEAVAEITSAEGLPLAEVGVAETGRPMEEADTKSTQRRR